MQSTLEGFHWTATECGEADVNKQDHNCAAGVLEGQVEDHAEDIIHPFDLLQAKPK